MSILTIMSLYPTSFTVAFCAALKQELVPLRVFFIFVPILFFFVLSNKIIFNKMKNSWFSFIQFTLVL